MKKEALLFLLVILLSGCVQTATLDTSEIQSNNLLSEFQKKYYSLTDEETEKIGSAILTGNEEDCDAVNLAETYESSLLAIKCKKLLIKLNAIKNRDFEVCNELYSETDTTDYEECLAPLVAESGIILKDKTYCKKYLKIQRLINVCEEEYESLL